MRMKSISLLAATMSAAVVCGARAAPGPDVTFADMGGISSYGAVGDTYGYALGSWTCNIGTQNLKWGTSWGGTPALAMNAYRLHDGRLVQVGMSWVKYSCCAAVSSSICGTCNGTGGSWLGVGCRDVYSSSYNGGQSRLGPRSGINAYTGFLGPVNSSTGNAIYKRLQVPQREMAGYGSALFFAEGVYVAPDDAEAGNWHNNVSHKRVNINLSTYAMTENGSMQIGVPTIQSWRDHGLGWNIPDPRVVIGIADVPGEGRFYYAEKVSDLGNGEWRYDYAIFNQNSDRAGGSFEVPIPNGVSVSNTGFHYVQYHSGEAYSNDTWTVTTSGGAVRWSSPQTFAQNANTNALRWGMMYNFWFTANVGPADGQATLGLFKPGTPTSLALSLRVPADVPCRADFNGDGQVDFFDYLDFVAAFNDEDPSADFNGDGQVDFFDYLDFVEAFDEGCD